MEMVFVLGELDCYSFSTREKAVKDAFRLSEAMTYKLALINSPYGGCKAVVFEPSEGKSIEFLHDLENLLKKKRADLFLL